MDKGLEAPFNTLRNEMGNPKMWFMIKEGGNGLEL